MHKCQKAKNPCKICLSPVTRKNGLKCEGACGGWVHFTCLNYTPGKIKDIKLGVIKVCCPCPDCSTPYPKEYLVDEPFSCNNAQCPANRPPSCQNILCPANAGGMGNDPYAAPTCPLSTCGIECKQNSHPHTPPSSAPPSGCTPQYIQEPHQTSYDLSSEVSCTNNDAPGDCNSYRVMAEQTSVNTGHMEQMCNTVGELSHKINELMVQMKNLVHCDDTGCQHRTGPNPCFCPGNPIQRK